MIEPFEKNVSTLTTPRENILRTASRLFYEDGIHAVGVDRIVAESGHPRATLYRHFNGKEGLVLEYLKREDALVRHQLEAVRSLSSPQQRLEAVVDGIADDASRYHRRGCPFINAAAEYPDAESDVRRTVTSHRTWFRGFLAEVFDAAGASEPSEAAGTLVLLRDAALVGSYLDDAKEVRQSFLRNALPLTVLG